MRFVCFAVPTIAFITFLLVSPAIAQPTFTSNIVDSNYGGANWVEAIDMDGDGDMDLVASAYVDDAITWYENDGNQSFTAHTIDDGFDGAWFVYPVDLDDDGDMDVLGASEDGDQVGWWENGGDNEFTYIVIHNNFDGAQSIMAYHADNNDDLDILACAKNSNLVAVFINDGSENFTQGVVTDEFTGVRFTWPGDMDGDGDMDVVAAGGTSPDGIMAWYENDGQGGWAETIIDENNSLDHKTTKTVDLDGDGDTDVIAACYTSGEIHFYENTDSSFVQHVIGTALSGAYGVATGDLDLDGDLDVIGGAWDGDEIVWWEQDEDSWVEHQVASTFDGARCVNVADMDGDTDLDVIGAARYGNQIAWFESNLDDQWQPPEPFYLISPSLGSYVMGGDTTLVWHAATEPDAGDSITHYVAMWATNSAFTRDVDSLVTTDTTCLAEDLIDQQLYFWKVRACDTNSDGRWSGVWTFFVRQLREPFNIESALDTASGAVDLTWRRYPISMVHELAYDSGVASNYHVDVPGIKIGVQMSPEEPCQILALKYYTMYAGNPAFNAQVLRWAEDEPGDSLYSQTANAAQEGWTIVTLSEEIFVEEDFTAVFDYVSSDVGLGYNANNNNQRAYYGSDGWYGFGSTVLIRAIVEYQDENVAELGPSGELDDYEFIEYIVYRDGAELGRTADSTWADSLPDVGQYIYTVSANYEDYGEVESSDADTVTWSGGFVHDPAPGDIPIRFAVEPAWPNPFNSTTHIGFDLPEETTLKLSIYNVMGQEVARLSDQYLQAGTHMITWNVDRYGLSSGIYFLRVDTGAHNGLVRLVYMK